MCVCVREREKKKWMYRAPSVIQARLSFYRRVENDFGNDVDDVDVDADDDDDARAVESTRDAFLCQLGFAKTDILCWFVFFIKLGFRGMLQPTIERFCRKKDFVLFHIS